jgi:hypothetical protein
MSRTKNDEGFTVDKLLQFIVSIKYPEVVRLRLTRLQLVQLLREYLDSVHAKADPALVLEEWEPELRQPRLIGDHLVKMNPYNSELAIEFIPYWTFLERAAELRNRNIAFETVQKIARLSPHEFERLLANVFSGVPWARNVNVGKISRDGGIDFEGEYVDSQTGLAMLLLGQAKHWKAKVGSEPVRTFVGSMVVKAKSHKLVGVYVATNGFTDDALKVIEESPYTIFPYNLSSLAALMIKNHIGVKGVKMEGYSLEDGFWDELAEG